MTNRPASISRWNAARRLRGADDAAPVAPPHGGGMLLWLVALVLAGTLALGVSTAARAAACQTSGPVNGSYTVTLCISSPTDGSTVTGSASVTATATVNGSNPGVQRMVFYLDGVDLLTDFQAPYTFALKSARFVDGARTLEAEALMRDGFVSERASASLAFQNGVTSPPPIPTGFTPRTGTTPPAGQSFVLAAVGDGAGGEQNAVDVVNLIDSWNPNMFLYLGDVYEKGTPTEYDNWYAPASSYGKFHEITNPTIGNHEYEKGQAPGYFDYWRDPPHYYSFNVAGWHVVSLDSSSQFNEVDPGTAQYTWLANDLTASTAACTLVYFHHPVYDVGPEGASPRLANLWSLLASRGVDVVLAAHDHNYQRYVRLDGSGAPSAGGIVQFVAGGGGHGIQQFVTTDSRLAAGFDSPGAFGALRLELNAHGTAFRYVNKGGTMLDSGSVACSGAPADTTAPSVPGGMTAGVAGPHAIDLSWSASTDNVGVTGYRILRNGSVLATVGPVTSYTDVTAAAELTYSYQVRAVDAAGNASALSTAGIVTTPAGETGIFADGFETGGLVQWTSVTGLAAQQQDVFSGSWAARGQSTGAATWAYKTLPSTYASLFYRIRFKVLGQSGNVYVLKFRTSTGVSMLGVYLTSTGKLAYRNDIAGQSVTSSATVASGSWHTLQVHVLLNGATGETETWLDDVKIPELSRTEALGTAQIGRLQLGENSTGRTYDIAFDTVLVDDSFIPTDTSAPTPPTVAATSSTPTTVDLSWTASSDNVGVAGYSVYRDGRFLVGLPASSLAYTDSGLDPSSMHTYALDAFDVAGNHSAQSSPATATTPPDTTPPSAPAGLAVTGVGSDEVDLAWNASTDDVAVAGYGIYRDGALIGTVETGVLDYVDTTVAQATTYAYTVNAFDAAGNDSQHSNGVQATTSGPPDTTPPTQPSGLTATAAGATRIDLAWQAASDDVGVTGYTIYRNGGELGTVSGSALAFSDTTVAPGNAYTYTIDAYDSAGNHSPRSAPASASAGGDVSPPTKPGGVTATAVGPGTVDIAWSASSDDVGVTGYTVYRDGAELASVAGSVLAYTDTSTAPSTGYSYTVDAMDAAANRSAQSDPASVTTPPAFLFADDFESGGLGQWTSVTGLVVQQQEVSAGAWAARATTTGPATWAYKTLATSQTSLYFRIRFKILSHASTVNVLKLRTSAGASLLGVYVGSNGKLGYRNDVAGQSTSSPVPAGVGVWHTLQVHVVINGSSGQVETWLDGTRISQLSKTESLGTTPIGRLQLGENSPDRTYDVAFDTVVADTSFIAG